jgi:hypothetical protein
VADPDFPDELRAFIRDHVPDVDASELLLFLAREPGRRYDLADLIAALRPTVITEAVARKHLALFQERGLVVSTSANTYEYAPDTPQLDALVNALGKVYRERPVTMVRMIYDLKDEKIRSFADAFRIKKP